MTSDAPVTYRGRFAPTPSGPLHFGSIVAATGSYADALAHGGEWHLRIDDLDPPRVARGAEASILSTLEALGFEWDGPLVRQSTRREAYELAIATLARHARVYPCTCTRAEIAAAGERGVDGPRYPGTCRDGPTHPGRPAALRIAVPEGPAVVEDLLQGQYVQDLARDIGDFVVRRADGIPSYHLACAVDDVAGRFTCLVRGADLLASTARQFHLVRLLGARPPACLHLPVALDASGEKLSKQTFAAAVDTRAPGAVIVRSLAFLGHEVPAAIAGAPPRTIWAWVRTSWRRARLPRARSLPAADHPGRGLATGP